MKMWGAYMYNSTSSWRGLSSALARTWSSFVRFNSSSKYFPKGLSHVLRAVLEIHVVITVAPCKPFGVTASIERWEENYDITHGCVKPPRSFIGRPKLLTADMIENIQELLREDPTLLDEVKEWVALYHDHSISNSALLSHINGFSGCGRTQVWSRPCQDPVHHVSINRWRGSALISVWLEDPSQLAERFNPADPSPPILVWFVNNLQQYASDMSFSGNSSTNQIRHFQRPSSALQI